MPIPCLINFFTRLEHGRNAKNHARVQVALPAGTQPNVVHINAFCSNENTTVETALTTSFLAQKLLNELFVRALAGAEPVLAGAEMVNRCAELVLASAELIDCETKLSYHGTQVVISRQALRGLRGRFLEFPQQYYQRDARQREHSLRRGD